MEAKWIIFLTYTFTSALIIAPIYIYWIYKYLQHKNDIVISKRTPQLTLIFAILGILARIIERPVWLFVNTYSDKYPSEIINSDVSAGIRFLYYLQIISFAAIQSGGSWILLLRYWMIYFNVFWTRATLNKGWSVHLNHLDTDKNWYLSHKSSFGNFKYNLKILCFIYFIMAVISVLITFIHSSIGKSLGSLISVLMTFPPILGLFILGYKIRKFQDYFHVIQEFNIISIYVSTYIIAYVIIGGLLPVVFGLTVYVRSLLVLGLSTCTSIIFMYLQTIYILRKVISDGLLSQQLSLRLNPIAEMSNSNSDNEMSSTDIVNTDIGSIVSRRGRNHAKLGGLLVNIVNNISKFESFMQHLSKEWSMELLLFVVEVTQLQNIIKIEYLNEIDFDTEDIRFIAFQNALLENKKK
eukprot:140507_1